MSDAKPITKKQKPKKANTNLYIATQHSTGILGVESHVKRFEFLWKFHQKHNSIDLILEEEEKKTMEEETGEGDEEKGEERGKEEEEDGARIIF